jgi:hypothetical protein
MNGCSDPTDVHGTTANKRGRIRIINAIRANEKAGQLRPIMILDAQVIYLKGQRVAEVWKVEDWQGDKHFYLVETSPDGITITPHGKATTFKFTDWERKNDVRHDQTCVPGDTTTRGQLREDVLSTVLKVEKLYSPSCSSKVVDTFISSVDENGKLIIEVWRVKSCWNKRTNYLVRLVPVAEGGTAFAISLAPNNESLNWLLDKELVRRKINDFFCFEQLK